MPYQYDPEKSQKRQQEQYSQMKKTLEGVMESYQEDPRLMLEYLKFKSNFPSYSARNTALIRTQNPHAVVTGSFKHWKDMGYRVKKGEHGLKIMVPVKTDLFRSERADGTRQTKSVKAATAKEQEEIRQGRIYVFERITYRVGYVFDISQTDCPPEAYPKLFSAGYPSETHAKLYEAVKAFAKGKGIPVEEANLSSISLRGTFTPRTNTIKISDRLNDTQKLGTLLHEMGHAILSETDAKRPVNSMKEPAAFMEAEADAVSILLHEHLGIEVPDTVKRHFMKSCEKLKGAGELDIGKLLNEVGKVYDEFRGELDPFLEQAVERETLDSEKTMEENNETAALKKELSKIDGWLGVPQYTQVEQADILSAAAASIERREKAQANGQELPDAPDVWDIALSEARDASMERLNDTVHTLFEIKDCKTPEELREKLKLNEQETASLTSLLQKGGELEETLKHVGNWLHYDNPGEFFEKADNSPLTLREQLGLDEQEMNKFLTLLQQDHSLQQNHSQKEQIPAPEEKNPEVAPTVQNGSEIQSELRDRHWRTRRGQSDRPAYEASKEQLEAIKNNVSILQVAQDLGFHIKKVGSYLTLQEHDSVRIYQDTNSFHQFSQGVGGSNIDFVMHFNDMDKKEAIHMLKETYLGDQEFHPFKTPMKDAASENVKEPKPFVLPEKFEGKYNRSMAYLTKTRCLDPKVVRQCMKAGLIYEDKRHNVVFVGKDQEGQEAYATRHSTLTNSSFKGDVSGSDQTLGFKVEGKNASRVYVTEAPIDALSLMSMDQQRGYDTGNATYLATCGTGKTKVVERYLKEHPEVKNVFLANDNDPAGQEANRKIAQLIKENDPEIVIRELIPKGNDVNDMLREMKNPGDPARGSQEKVQEPTVEVEVG